MNEDKSQLRCSADSASELLHQITGRLDEIADDDAHGRYGRLAREAMGYLQTLTATVPQEAPAWENLTAIIRPMIESVCSDGNSDAARLAKDIADRIIASCSLTRPKEK